MNKDTNLTALSQKLAESKKQELDEIKKIETAKLNALSESLRKSLETELNTLESDMIERHKTLAKKLSQIRVKTYKAEEEGLKQIEDEALTLFETLNKVKARYWITPLIVGLTLSIGLAIGLWGLGVAITDRSQTLQALNEEVANGKKQREALKGHEEIVKQYGDGIEVKRQPKVFQLENGNYAVVWR